MRLANVAILLTLASVTFLVACAGMAEEPAVIEVTLDKPGDTAIVNRADDRALIEVTSATGIGGLQATLTAGSWPKQVTARLRLRGLESLEIRYGDVTLSTGMASSGASGSGLMLSITKSDGTIESASPSADIYYPVIERGADTVGDYFDVTLPPHFYDGAYESFELNWIDFYR